MPDNSTIQQDPADFEVWNPKQAGAPKGRTGVLVGTGKFVNGEQNPALVLRMGSRDEHEDFALVCFDAMLKAKLRELEPALELGDELRFEYGGKKPLKSDPSRSKNLWSVYRTGDEQGIDRSLLGEEEPPVESDVPADTEGLPNLDVSVHGDHKRQGGRGDGERFGDDVPFD